MSWNTLAQTEPVRPCKQQHRHTAEDCQTKVYCCPAGVGESSRLQGGAGAQLPPLPSPLSPPLPLLLQPAKAATRPSPECAALRGGSVRFLCHSQSTPGGRGRETRQLGNGRSSRVAAHTGPSGHDAHVRRRAGSLSNARLINTATPRAHLREQDAGPARLQAAAGHAVGSGERLSRQEAGWVAAAAAAGHASSERACAVVHASFKLRQSQHATRSQLRR